MNCAATPAVKHWLLWFSIFDSSGDRVGSGGEKKTQNIPCCGGRVGSGTQNILQQAARTLSAEYARTGSIGSIGG